MRTSIQNSLYDLVYRNIELNWQDGKELVNTHDIWGMAYGAGDIGHYVLAGLCLMKNMILL